MRLFIAPAAVALVLPLVASAQSNHQTTSPEQWSVTDHKAQMLSFGEVICDLNPYTKQPVSPTTGLQTGTMHVMTEPEVSVPENGSDVTDKIKQRIHVTATDDAYKGGEWTVGQTKYSIRKAAVIPYTFDFYDKEGRYLYSRTEHVVVGFAGSDGGG